MVLDPHKNFVFYAELKKIFSDLEWEIIEGFSSGLTINEIVKSLKIPRKELIFHLIFIGKKFGFQQLLESGLFPDIGQSDDYYVGFKACKEKMKQLLEKKPHGKKICIRNKRP